MASSGPSTEFLIDSSIECFDIWQPTFQFNEFNGTVFAIVAVNLTVDEVHVDKVGLSTALAVLGRGFVTFYNLCHAFEVVSFCAVHRSTFH
jgi:hypothetical protein